MNTNYGGGGVEGHATGVHRSTGLREAHESGAVFEVLAKAGRCVNRPSRNQALPASTLYGDSAPLVCGSGVLPPRFDQQVEILPVSTLSAREAYWREQMADAAPSPTDTYWSE